MRLKNDFQGKTGERIPHDWLNTIANFWNDLAIVGGSLKKRSDGRFTTISFASGTANGDDLLAAFLITDTDGTIATMQPGTFFLDGTPKTIIGLPATISCPSTIQTWIRHDTSAGTVQWQTGTTRPLTSGTIVIYPVHSISSEGTTIGTVYHEHPANFHVASPAAPEYTTSAWQTMGTIAEHADTAGTDSWASGGTLGLKFTGIVDIGYDHTAGTPRLFAVKREDTHDRYGKLTAMGTETIVEIDTPVNHADL